MKTRAFVDKTMIDARVAAEVDLPEKDVREITAVFLEEIRNKLLEKQRVVLRNFGTFDVRIQRYNGRVRLMTGGDHSKIRVLDIKRCIRVTFSRGDSFRNAFRALYGNSSSLKGVSHGKARRAGRSERRVTRKASK